MGYAAMQQTIPILMPNIFVMVLPITKMEKQLNFLRMGCAMVGIGICVKGETVVFFNTLVYGVRKIIRRLLVKHLDD